MPPARRRAILGLTMKTAKLAIAVAASLSLATPVFACPTESEAPRTAEKSDKAAEAKETAKADQAKPAEKTKAAKPAEKAKAAKPGDKVSQR